MSVHNDCHYYLTDGNLNLKSAPRHAQKSGPHSCELEETMEVRGRDLCPFSHDASCLAVCGADGEVKIWDGPTNQLIARFSPGGARGGPVTAAACAREREHVSSRAKVRLFAPLRRSLSLPILSALPLFLQHSRRSKRRRTASPSLPSLAVGVGSKVVVWDVAGGEEERQLVSGGAR